MLPSVSFPTILPPLRVYLGFGSNYINEQQERQILSNPEAYALCVAELQPVEEAAR